MLKKIGAKLFSSEELAIVSITILVFQYQASIDFVQFLLLNCAYNVNHYRHLTS